MGVLASEQGMELLKEAMTQLSVRDNKRWRYQDVADAVNVASKTVERFFRREQAIDEGIARIICALLNVEFADVVEKTKADSFGQSSGNPFNFGSPVSPDRFYGRRDVLNHIGNRIGARTAQSVNLIGLRRSGKTSVLRYVRSRLNEFCVEAQKPVLVSLDLQNQRFHTPDGLVEGLRRGIKEKTGEAPWESEGDAWDIQDGLEGLRDRGFRLIVLLDEFEAIGNRLKEFENWGEDWRSKVSDGVLTLVIASQRSLSEVYGEFGLTSPFSNVFSTTVLGSLEEQEWRRLIQEGFEKKVSEEWMQWVDRVAGGVPFYVQIAGAMLWQYQDLRAAQENFAEQCQNYFPQLWRGLTRQEQVAMRGERAVQDGVGRKLEQRGLLRQDGRMFSEMFAVFVREQ